MLDLNIVNGEVVTPDGVRSLDIGISGGVISVLAERGQLPPAAEVIDAAGKVVVPGAVDPHTHANSPMGRERDDCLTREEITKAAIYGGTTTVIDFVWQVDPEHGGQELVDRVEEHFVDWEAESTYTDFGFHVGLRGTLSEETLKVAVPTLIDSGFPSFKIFTTDILPRSITGRPGLMLQFGSLEDLFEVAARHGGLINVHAEDDDIVMHKYDKYIGAGKRDLEYMPEVHTTISEDISYRRVLRLAQHYPGVALYFHHLTARYGVEALAEYRAKGVAAYGEAINVIAMNTAERYKEPEGYRYHIYPSLKYQEDVEAIWTGLADGTVHTFGTDGACPKWSAKSQGHCIDDAFGGVTGFEPKMGVIYTELVQNRGLGLKRFVETTSENAARIFGLYPQKGAIAVGSDADIVVMDPDARKVVRAADMHEGDFTPWEGREVSAWPTHTLLRGEVLMAEGELTRDTPTGRGIRRQLVPQLFDGTLM